jgi:PAS domain-containing protein
MNPVHSSYFLHTLKIAFSPSNANLSMNVSSPADFDENTSRLEERVRALEAALQEESEARQKSESRMRHLEAALVETTSPLRANEDAAYLRALLDNMEAGVMACNAAGELILFNRRMSEMLGRPLENVPAEHWAEHYGLHSVDGRDILPMHEVPLVRALEGQTVIAAELLLKPANVTHNATHRVLEVDAQPIVDAQGRHLGAVCVAHDISESKLIRDALLIAEGRLSALLANLPIIVFALDTQGVFTFSDGLGLQLLGIAPGAVVGLSAYDIYQDYPVVTENIRKTLQGEHSEWQSQINGVTFQTQCAPLYDDKGQLCGATGVALDMTQCLHSKSTELHDVATPQNEATREGGEA